MSCAREPIAASEMMGLLRRHSSAPKFILEPRSWGRREKLWERCSRYRQRSAQGKASVACSLRRCVSARGEFCSFPIATAAPFFGVEGARANDPALPLLLPFLASVRIFPARRFDHVLSLISVQGTSGLRPMGGNRKLCSVGKRNRECGVRRSVAAEKKLTICGGFCGFAGRRMVDISLLPPIPSDWQPVGSIS